MKFFCTEPHDSKTPVAQEPVGPIAVYTAEVCSVRATYSMASDARAKVFVDIPGQQPIGKKYRVTVQELEPEIEGGPQ